MKIDFIDFFDSLLGWIVEKVNKDQMIRLTFRQDNSTGEYSYAYITLADPTLSYEFTDCLDATFASGLLSFLSKFVDSKTITHSKSEMLNSSRNLKWVFNKYDRYVKVNIQK